MHLNADSLTSLALRLQAHLPDRFARTPRKITPARLIGVLIMMTGFGRKGYRRVVDELRQGLGRAFGWPDLHDVPSPQALGQARRSLSPAVCAQALRAVREGCAASSRSGRRGYRGYRVLAVDGTRLCLPPTKPLIEHFGLPSNQSGQAAAPMAGLVQLWDVGANCPVSFAMTPCDFDERSTAMGLFAEIGPRDLLIGDRGFPSFCIFAALRQRRCRFLLRCSKRFCSEVIDFLASGSPEAMVAIPQRGSSDEPAPAVHVRLVRIELPNGVSEVLATNLWAHLGHSREALSDLYTRRWTIETAFREMKVFHALENFSATYPDGIYQEITAIQIFLLLTAELEAMAHEHTAAVDEPADATAATPDRRTIRFNRLMISDAVIHVLRAAAHSPEAARKSLAISLESIWKSRSKARPGRSFPRMRKRPLRGYRP
jgi:hypothetical protein